MGDLLRARAKFLPQLAQEISEGRLAGGPRLQDRREGRHFDHFARP